MSVLRVLALLALTASVSAAETIQGRWTLVAAEDLRADGSVGRSPWGRRPVGAVVVDNGWCYVQIMSSDVPSFSADRRNSQGCVYSDFRFDGGAKNGVGRNFRAPKHQENPPDPIFR